MIRWLPRSVSFREVERRLAGMTDGLRLVVAFEVFDHPEAAPARRTSRDAEKGALTGPWLIGDEDECRAELARRGFEDFTQQASAGLGEREEH